MIEFRVREGDCMISIAEKHGFFWETLWNLPENAELKNTHEDHTILLPGDIVYIPELREKKESVAAEQIHTFQRKGIPAKLRLQMMRPVVDQEDTQSEDEPSDDEPPEDEPLEVVEEDPEPEEGEEEPWADAPFILVIDGVSTYGQTDSEGKLVVPIPPNAKKGKLTMEPGTDREEVIPLRLGYLDPFDSITGIADRLNNLGYHDGSRSSQMDENLAESIREFQKANGLQETGNADQATVDKLREMHGS